MNWNPYFTQTLAMGTGIFASNKTSNTLVGLDQKFNFSGNYPKSFSAGMSAEDAARYEQFWQEVEHGLDVDSRIKINNWKYTPSAELYLKYKNVYDNPKYYDQITGEINWPGNDGFKNNSIEKIISKNTIFKRYGGEEGEFLGNATDPFETRSLAPHSDPELTNTEIHYYQLIEDSKMTTGEAAPWFDSNGGAEQFVIYKSDGSKYTIKEMLNDGILEDITDLIENGDVKID